MNKLTRRTFGKRILAAGAAPLFTQQTEQTARVTREIFAGYNATPEETGLAATFLAAHEKNLAPLRERALPNALPPYFIVATPIQQEKSAERAQ